MSTHPRAQHSGPIELSGWGRGAPSAADVVHVSAEELASVVKSVEERGAITRGLGRSYGDPAQNAGGTVIRLQSAADSIVIAHDAGEVTVGAGVSLDDLLAVIVPLGYFVPVTPGTRFVTIGGAIASDIHGKNHHVDGSFAHHVVSMCMMLADTTVVEVSPHHDAELFWATVGGMGLTGVILSVTFRLIPIETSRMSVETRRIGHLDEIMERMATGDAGVRYSVAWLDLMARGRHLGRGVLTNADHARLDELDGREVTAPLASGATSVISVPRGIPSPGVINQATVAAFNEMWFRKAPRHRSGELQSIPAYFHPLDLVGDWNRVYGRRGAVQYQFVVPLGAEQALRTVIERISAARLPIFLTVLKRFGPGNQAPLSFPFAGWTLAIDVPTGCRGLADLLHHLDGVVLDAGGRHYLAKDHQTTAEAVGRGYPRLDEWKSVRERVDPTGVWASDLGRRLGLLN